MDSLHPPRRTCRSCGGFAFADLLAILAVVFLLMALGLPFWSKTRARSQEEVCTQRLAQIARATLSYSTDNAGRLPDQESGLKGPVWWHYKEQVKGYLGGDRGARPSSAADRDFACPADRGYDDGKPFRLSAKFDYTSYVFNGVHIPGVPNIAGRAVSSIRESSRTLLVMEWAAHAPLSWHRSRTGSKNEPFYNDAESVVAFVDGRVETVPIYYDGINPAYTRDPIPGYKYKYSGD